MYRSTLINLQEYQELFKLAKNNIFTQDPRYALARKNNFSNFYFFKTTFNKQVVSIGICYLLKRKKIFYQANLLYGPLFLVNDVNYSNLFKSIKELILKINKLIIEIIINPYTDDVNVALGLTNNNFNKIDLHFYQDQRIAIDCFYIKKVQNMNHEQFVMSWSQIQRQNLKKLNLLDLKVIELKTEEIEIFTKLMNSNYQRKKTNLIFNPQLVLDLMNSFSSDAKLIAVKIRVKELLNKSLSLLNDDKLAASMLKSLNEMNLYLRQLIDQGIEEIITSVAFYLYSNKQLFYFLSASEVNFKFFNTNILLHSEIFKLFEDHVDIYNLFGISGILEPNEIDYGAYLYKTKFHGEVFQSIGSFRYLSNIGKLLLKNDYVLKKD